VADVDRQVRAALELVQLAGKEKRLPSQLSGGERQRTALSRALVLRPSIVLLDEPLSALDPGLRKQMRSELKQLQRTVGVTFLFVTHDQEEALSLSDRIAVMNHGRIEQTGTPRELYARPGSPFVAGFLGTVNWVDGVGIRPENTRLSRTRPEGDARCAAATVAGSVFLGNCIHIRAELPGGQIVVAEVPPADGDYRPGESVQVWWRPDDEMVFPAERR
jgi:ABC-type Fe3+/spermidine/putrescine transport system ATPase subunit